MTLTDQTGLSQPIPANSVPTPVTLSNAATMSITSVNACQGATFTIPVTISVQRPCSGFQQPRAPAAESWRLPRRAQVDHAVRAAGLSSPFSSAT